MRKSILVGKELVFLPKIRYVAGSEFEFHQLYLFQNPMTETKKAFRLLFVGVVVSIAVGVFSIAVLLPILPDIDRDRYPENLQQQGN